MFCLTASLILHFKSLSLSKDSVRALVPGLSRVAPNYISIKIQ